MQHLDEGTIHAWLDGALDGVQAAEAEAHVKQCASCSAAVAEARGLIAASSRILTALDDVPAGVIPKPAVAPTVKPARRQWRAAPWVSGIAAAALLFAIGITQTRMSPRVAAFDRAATQRDVSMDTSLVGVTGAPPTGVESAAARDAAVSAMSERQARPVAAPSRRMERSMANAATQAPQANRAQPERIAPVPSAPSAMPAAVDDSKLAVAKSVAPLPALEQVKLGGCYRLTSPTVRERGAASGSVAAGGRAVAAEARAAAGASRSYVASVPGGIIRLDTTQKRLGYPVRAESSDTTTIGWWSRVGNDTADVRLLSGVAFKVSARSRVACSER